MIEVQKLTDSEVEAAMERTGLGFAFAADLNMDGITLKAAHGVEDSYVLVRTFGKMSGFKLTGGGKLNRRERYLSVIVGMLEHLGGGEIHHADGRPFEPGDELPPLR